MDKVATIHDPKSTSIHQGLRRRKDMASLFICNSNVTPKTPPLRLLQTNTFPPSLPSSSSLHFCRRNTRGLSVVTRGAPSTGTYIFAFFLPLSLLAVTVFTSIRIADKLDRDFLEEMAINQAIMEGEEEDGVADADAGMSLLEEKPSRPRTLQEMADRLDHTKKNWKDERFIFSATLWPIRKSRSKVVFSNDHFKKHLHELVLVTRLTTLIILAPQTVEIPFSGHVPCSESRSLQLNVITLVVDGAWRAGNLWNGIAVTTNRPNGSLIVVGFHDYSGPKKTINGPEIRPIWACRYKQHRSHQAKMGRK
ncbi:hypothetical protein Vadar_000894 [Vaccinium darrowii]|uniref:Uncharacterized protein n=1 Tax=Vaccinium darrowii TaxID=229202 RepID=A0ACB7ZG38_9ERIC|nr:hypothetical protein Vadar_000894 [Vaccinium darrowii]